jgi:hypothetical protein
MARCTRWRLVLTALSCLLLPLPLAGLLLISMSGPVTPAQRGPSLISMLSADARRALPTYDRACDTDADCDAPLGCLMTGSLRFKLCTDSTCATDQDCPENFSCVTLKTHGGKALVRTCSLMGERKEGERCRVLPTASRLGCERGLLCQGWCGRPCRLGEPSSCPEGFFCSEGPRGPPSCLPTCEGRTCPEGQQCLSRGSNASVCTEWVSEDCRRSPCPEGHFCKVLETPSRPWELRTECMRLCGKDTPCSEGFVCIDYQCRRACDPEHPASCGPGATCERNHPDDPWSCLPG